ncbi:MAG: triose-phosphate isomerase [Maricaulaceae bacterium]
MRSLIAANWKMNGSVGWIDKPERFDQILPQAGRESIDVLICPPATLLPLMLSSAQMANIHLGAQNCHAAPSGAHTGDISAAMAKEVGASYVIVGHSERRALGETNANVRAKAVAAQENGLVPIICVGESLSQREAGQQNKVAAQQLAESLPSDSDAPLVIAYEPIWAIGTGMTATPDDIAQMHAHIRDIVGDGVQILYGGSVKPANAAAILGTPNVNGALIGGASLEMESLAEIAKAALAL